MPSVHDVATYILKRTGRITAMKLEKLVYYSQAWSLVWDDKPLFAARIEAWANGPVVPALFQKHQGIYEVRTWDGHASGLTREQRETVNGVLAFYGDKSSQWLSDLTHREGPWLQARAGLGANERGSREITHASMVEYYSGLYNQHAEEQACD
jgi:uncharacterized phage-associated protein